MKNIFSFKQKWCIIVCILITLNGIVFTQIYKMKYEIQTTDERTEQFAVQLLQMQDSNRKTLVTHLLTMDAFVDEARAIFNNNSFPEGVCAMLAYDGDGMGKKSETYGAMAVNKLMVAFADVTKEHFPENELNIVCNVGEKSDEFYVLLMGRTSQDALLAEVEAFQEDIRKIRVTTENGEEIGGTVSIGVAFYEEGDTFEGLFEEADTAGYAAKQAGKDCYFVSVKQEVAANAE